MPTQGQTEGTPGEAVKQPGRVMPSWVRWAPYFLSSFAFLSYIFTVFAPLPIMIANIANRKNSEADPLSPEPVSTPANFNTITFVAIFTNATMIFFVAGLTLAAAFVMTVGITAYLLPNLLIDRRIKIETAVFTNLVMVLLGFGVLLIVASMSVDESLLVVTKREFLVIIEQFKEAAQGQTELHKLSKEELEEMVEKVIFEIPSGLAIFVLIMSWVNLTLMLRINPNNFRKKLGFEASILKKWKSPEWLVWPTIVSGGVLLLENKGLTVIGTNFFKVFMAVYAIQGLSIMAFYFDHWKLSPMLRSIGFVAAVLFFMPLLLGLGFFDLWFDFRGKIRQS